MTTLSMRLDLPWLGGRTYLHGTTLFDELARLVPGSAAVTFKVSKLIRSDRIELVPVAGTTDMPPGMHASLTWETPTAAGGIGVVPLPGSPAPKRREYNEALVTEAARFAPGEAVLESPSPFSFVATIVPLHKALLQREVSPQPRGQWLFTRLDLAYVPVESTPVALRLDSRAARSIVKSRVRLQGREIGSIYFSWSERSS